MRILLLRFGPVSANSGSGLRRTRRCLLLRVTGSDHPTHTSRDWLGSAHTSLLAWWVPNAAILAGLFVPVSFRAVIWIIALIWMGTACILNARRCNRTHCRYTGPYYLAMVVPVLLDFSLVPGPAGYNGEMATLNPKQSLIWFSVVLTILVLFGIGYTLLGLAILPVDRETLLTAGSG